MQKQNKIISLDIDESSVVATALAKRNKRIHLDRYAVVAGLKELAADLFFRGAEVIINLPSQIVLFRTFHLAPSFFKGKNMQKDILAFLQRQNLPFRLEDCYWNSFTTGTDLNLIAARKDAVDRHVFGAEGAGFHVAGVCVSLIALYNVLIHTYPERSKDRFAVLNIKTASSDLIIYEAGRLWTYPLSSGSRNLHETKEATSEFSAQVQRVFSSHYLQNPAATASAANYFYVTGKGSLEPLIAELKKVLVDFQIAALSPLRAIESSVKNKDYPINQQALSLSLGLGLAYADIPFGLKINLIEEKRRKAKTAAAQDVLQGIGFFFALFFIGIILVWDIKLISDLSAQSVLFYKSEQQVSSLMPQTKALIEEKQGLSKIEDFLNQRLAQEDLYLNSLAVVSQAKPSTVTIREFEALAKDGKLSVVISGVAGKYEDINIFLNELKKKDSVKDVKVMASTFPATEAQVKDIDFKLRFEIPVRDAQGVRKEQK